MVKYCNIRRRRHNTRSTTTGGSEEDLIVVIAGGGEENLKGWKREDQRRFFTRSLPWPMRLSRGGGRRWGCRSDRSWMYVHRTRDLCDIYGVRVRIVHPPSAPTKFGSPLCGVGARFIDAGRHAKHTVHVHRMIRASRYPPTLDARAETVARREETRSLKSHITTEPQRPQDADDEKCANYNVKKTTPDSREVTTYLACFRGNIKMPMRYPVTNEQAGGLSTLVGCLRSSRDPPHIETQHGSGRR